MAKEPLVPASRPPGLTRFETLLMKELDRLSEELRTTKGPDSLKWTEIVILLAVHRRVATDLRKLRKLHRWTIVQLVARDYDGQLDHYVDQE